MDQIGKVRPGCTRVDGPTEGELWKQLGTAQRLCLSYPRAW